jgi:hypothetical protein
MKKFKVKRIKRDISNKSTNKQTRKNSAEKIITGFFGLFDILGYSSLMKNNSLEKLIEIYNSVVAGIDKAAVTINHTDENQDLSFDKIGSFLFSDTIVLFQEYSTVNLPGGSFILKAALLMRLAFEKGIPLRGAISYGRYYITTNCFLGKPIVEAYEMEKIQEWSGAILCDSAKKEYNFDMKKRVNTDKMNFHGIELNPATIMSPFMENLILEYNVPTKIGLSKRPVICWDDYVPIFCNIETPTLEPSNFEERVQDSFSKYNKGINNERVKIKMENTVKFLKFSENRSISTRLIYRG